MRILIACHDCQQTYDASKCKMGSRFRCRCGQVLTVVKPQGHSAAVIRCSACGSPREQSINRCTYCGADFTIRERDLHTVCPRCLARVSEKSQFCTHCGSALAGETVDRIATKTDCPCCGGRAQLVSRRLGEAKVRVLECPVCAGLWLSVKSFRALRDYAIQQSSPVGAFSPDAPRLKRRDSVQRAHYRKCLVCEKTMQRRSYGRGSGVIIDTCRQHGAWFDDGELQQVIEWIRLGGRSGSSLDVALGEKSSQSALPLGEPPRVLTPTSYAIPDSTPHRSSRDFLDHVVGGFLSHVGKFFLD